MHAAKGGYAGQGQQCHVPTKGGTPSLTLSPSASSFSSPSSSFNFFAGMNAQSLFASAAINIGLALITIFLFSILKKQPSNAPIYYSRRLSHRHPIPSHHHHNNWCCSTLLRFLPSVSWIPQAFRVSEDEILHTSGLDALVVIRLFKFGSFVLLLLLLL